MNHFEVYKSWFRWRWRFVAKNGEIVAQGQGYTTRAKCVHGIRVVQKSHRATISK